MPTLSVVVPATDAPGTLERCRRAILAASGPPDELIVVDGPSGLSPAAARNAGARQARGEVVVFVDSDVEVHRDVFSRLRQAFDVPAGVIAVFGSYDDAPAARGVVSAFRNLLHHHVHQASPGPAETFWTGLGAVRRSSFLAAGGFDEERFPHPSVEDIDLGERLRRHGTIVLDPAIQGTHLKAWTLRSMLWTDFARRGVPWVGLQLRSRRLSCALNCGWRHRASAAACAAGATALVFGRFLVAAGALAAFVALNLSFYALLSRRRGIVEAVAGVVLHGLHHLVAALAVPAGLVAAVVAVPRRAAVPRPLPSPGEDIGA